MARLYRRLADVRIVVLLFAIVVLLLYLLQVGAASFTSGDARDHLNMQCDFRKDSWVERVQGWADYTGDIESAVYNYRTYLLKYDIAFPVFYILFFMSMIALSTNKPGKQPDKLALTLFLLPILAGMFDLAENYMHISILQGVRTVADLYGIPSTSIRVAYAFTVLKYSLVVLPPLAAILLWTYRRWFGMERQTCFPADSRIQKLKSDKIRRLFVRADTLSYEKRQNIRAKIGKGLRALEAVLDREQDETRRLELMERAGEIKERRHWFAVRATRLDTVLGKEKAKIKERREKAAREFEVALAARKAREGAGEDPGEANRRSEAEKAYQDQLGNADRPPIGLAFSGGGIRSAIFNLGLVQGLAKYGLLPWVDYVTSVSGGGLTAACMTTLLSMDKKVEKIAGKGKKREYYHFNTQWDYFPFNPHLQVFGSHGVAHTGQRTGTVGPPLKRGTNTQLQYLRDNGYFIMPRMGWATRDVLRGIGAFLAPIAYTLSVVLLALVVFSAFHYGLTAALTPRITSDDIHMQDAEPGLGELTVNLGLEDRALVVDLPFGAPGQEDDEAERGVIQVETVGELLRLLFGDYEHGAEAAPSGETHLIHPAWAYVSTLAVGFLFAWFVGFVLVVLYRKDLTTPYRLRPWKWPREDVTPLAYLTISRIRILGWISFVVLAALTLLLWLSHYHLWSDVGLNLRDFYWAWGLAFIPLAGVALWYLGWHARDYRWAKRGLPEQLRIDNLVKYLVVGLFLWVMALLISYLRFQSGPDLRIFWVWLSAVFTLGSMIGLVVFRVCPWGHRVYREENQPYTTESIGWFCRLCFWMFRRTLGIKKDPDYREVASSPSNYRLSIWSNQEFRSVFWSLQGLAFYALGVFLLSGLLAIPHYFPPGTGGVPIGTTIIGAVWAAFLSLVGLSTGSGEKNLLVRILALPEGVRRYVLGVLVIVLNLLVIFLVQSAIDDSSVQRACLVGAVALVSLLLIGRCLNFNHLTPHYFARDRMAEVFMKTEVETPTGEVELARDDQEERLWWMTPGGCSAPYHIVLTALNLPGSWHLKHKDRRSEPFIFSKYYCGSDITGYVWTDDYRGGLTKYSRAIALSGAAVSPGLGYHTFFAQAFMTTLLNVRLGLWMVSPQEYTYDVLREYEKPHQRETKTSWLGYLADEALGRISDRKPLINLTDGEHTGDGLGLYPLFQRRCKVIIAGDGSGDPAGHATGLYSVIRQVKVDLGIEVKINVDGTRPAEFDREKKTAKPSQRHFAVGTIEYPPTFDDENNQVLPGSKGWLIYFKTAVTERDPEPIRSYWNTHKMDFPSPSTADQFFDEEQWEFQRWLGEFTVDDTLKELIQYCDRRIMAAPKEGMDEQDIDLLTDQRNLAEGCWRHQTLDYGLLAKKPGLFDEVMSTLCEISEGSTQISTKEGRNEVGSNE